MHTTPSSKPRIVVVGGGAGGLELVTKLGQKLGRKGKAEITLIDRNTTHLWKPLLHEIAVGTMDEGVDAVSYRPRFFLSRRRHGEHKSRESRSHSCAH